MNETVTTRARSGIASGACTRRRFAAGALGAAGLLLGRGVRAAAGVALDLRTLLQPVPRTARFAMKGYYVWGGRPVRGPDGRYHLFFARWAKSTTFRGWVSHSEIGRAVADAPLGPYAFAEVVLAGGHGDAWDAHMFHNPTITAAGGKYYLYYTGTRGTAGWKKDAALKKPDDYWVFRNNQRVGVAVADRPTGPWKRFEKPLIDVSPSGWDSLITTNPSVCPVPGGRFMMVYKAASPGKRPAGRVVHGVAFADNPLGPFKKHPDPIFTHETAAFPAEDPTVWRQDGRYYAIVKDMGGYFTDAGRSLVLFESRDGIDWRLGKHPLVSTLRIRWADGETQKVFRLERPQVFLEEGRPTALFCAVHPGRKHNHTFNVHIPLKR